MTIEYRFFDGRKVSQMIKKPIFLLKDGNRTDRKKCNFCGKEYLVFGFQEDRNDKINSKCIVQAQTAQCQCQSKYDNAINYSVIGTRAKTSSFENFLKEIQPRPYDRARKYVDNFTEHQKTGKGIIFVGGCGTGKTHLASAIVSEVIEKYFGICIIQSTAELFSRLRQGNYDLLDGIYICDLLVLDDFGRERPTDWVKEQFFLIINYRYNELKPIIYTTNFNAKQLSKNVDEVVLSRIYEMNDVVRMTEGDYRLKNK